MSAKEYWGNLYTNNMDACIVRVYQGAHDFLSQLTKHIPTHSVFHNAKSVFEFGCGTGDFGRLVRLVYRNIQLYKGVDISEPAINYAISHYGGPGLEYSTDGSLSEGMVYDVVFSSNTLEHFADYRGVVDKMLAIGRYVVLVVPYDQRVLDGASDEGGAGHVVTLTEQSFSGYSVVDFFTFFTHTWVHGDNPLQMVIMLKSDKHENS